MLGFNPMLSALPAKAIVLRRCSIAALTVLLLLSTVAGNAEEEWARTYPNCSPRQASPAVPLETLRLTGEAGDLLLAANLAQSTLRSHHLDTDWRPLSDSGPCISGAQTDATSSSFLLALVSDHPDYVPGLAAASAYCAAGYRDLAGCAQSIDSQRDAGADRQAQTTFCHLDRDTEAMAALCNDTLLSRW